MADEDEPVAVDSVPGGSGMESVMSVSPETRATVPSQEAGEAVAPLRELVVYLIHNLVEDPEQVSVVADQRGSVVQIRVRLPESELGKVIGRGGRIAKAIRTALMIAGSRHHLRVSLDIES